MCGVFAYIGKRDDAAHIIFEGLKTLEYRGYDSWGIAVSGKEKITIEKHTGKIGDKKIHLPKSSFGIGHTRWATHGGVTVENAHPHLDCTKTIALLHNGIIENYALLKKTLSHHPFASETDTEVVVHLIEEYLKKNTFPHAVMKAFRKLQGLNALVVLNNQTGELVAVKNGSPLVVGIGKEEYMVASDVAGILPYTRDVIFLQDNELVVFNNTITTYAVLSGQQIAPAIEHLSWNIQRADKGNFKHFMLKEISEQPVILESIANTATERVIALSKKIKQAQGTFFIGAGTAYHASLSGIYLFSCIAKRQAHTAMASEFTYLEAFLNKKSLVIALSQSGETIDVIEPITRAKQKGASVLGIVNTLGSTLYRMSDETLLLQAGPEKAVASTKVYTAKLAVLLLLSYALEGNLTKGVALLQKTAKEVDRLLSAKSLRRLKKLAKVLSTKEHIYTIGRGLSFPLALEAALKIKEVSYIHTEGLAGGELKHGPIALIEKGTPCIVFAPTDETYDAIISNAMEIKARGGYIIGVSEKASPVFDAWVEVQDSTPGFSISAIVPFQLLAYFLALEKKLDPDKPRNLAKSVTVK